MINPVMDDSQVHRTVHNFINTNSNYMKVSFATEVRLRELLLLFNHSDRATEEELWERLGNICPAFCEWMERSR